MQRPTLNITINNHTTKEILLASLNTQLKSAVKDEDWEYCLVLRDAIKAVENPFIVERRKLKKTDRDLLKDWINVYELVNLKDDDLVLIFTGFEFIWVILNNVDKCTLTGIVISEGICNTIIHGLIINSLVAFEKKHVLSVKKS